MASAQATSTWQQATKTVSPNGRISTLKILAAMRDDFRHDAQLLQRDVKTIMAACKNKALRQVPKVHRLFGLEKPVAHRFRKYRAAPLTTLEEVRSYEKPTTKLVTLLARTDVIAKRPIVTHNLSEGTEITPASLSGQSSIRYLSTSTTEATTPGRNSLNNVTLYKRAIGPQLRTNQSLGSLAINANTIIAPDEDEGFRNTSSELIDFTATMKRKAIAWFKSTHNARLFMPEEERTRLRGITVLLLMIFELCFANPSHDQFRGGKSDPNNTERVASILEKACTISGQDTLQRVFRDFVIVEAKYPSSEDTEPILTTVLLQEHRAKHDPPAAIYLWAALVAALDYHHTNTADATEALLRLILPDQNVTELVRRVGSADKNIRRLSENEHAQLSDKLHAILDPNSKAIRLL